MLKRIKDLFNRKKEPSVEDKINTLYDGLYNDPILVNIGEDLSKFEKIFFDIIHELRVEVNDECGFIIPKVPVVYNFSLQENEFVIYIRGEYERSGFLIPNEEGIKSEFYDTFKTIIYDKMGSIFTNEVAERYIDTAQRKNGWLIWNITRVLSVPDIKIILSDIINNGKSINDIGYIFEKIGEEILLDGGYQDYFSKKYNPHAIAKEIVKIL